MASVNKFIGIGNLGADPETRFMPNGNAVCNFRIACTESWKDKSSGDRKESTEWVSITTFGKLAEICGQYLKKGSSVYVEGKLKTDEYEKDGVKRYSTKIIADEMRMLGGKPEGASQQRAEGRTEQADRGRSKPAASSDPFDDGDIPF